VKGELAQYRELAAFAQFGSDLDAQTKGVLDKGDRFVELFKQPPNAPKAAEIQVALIWAMQSGFFADLPAKSVPAASAALQTHLESVKPAALGRIRAGEKIDDAMAAELKSACEVWKRSFKA
jgi:F-type H+-transporting ATPase subunit alpha